MRGFTPTIRDTGSRRFRTRCFAMRGSSWASACTRSGMTVAEAEEYFVKEGYQSPPVARSESKRGTSDPTYGYYTMGKLMILKLREDYRAKMGARFSLQDFHDTFIKLGPLPLPLIRKAMLGEIGSVF